MKCDRICRNEKRDHIAHFLNFHFKTLITWKVEQLQTSTLVWFSHHPATLAWSSVPYLLLVWAGQAHKSITFENRRFMPHFGGSPFSRGGLLSLVTLDLWSRRPKLSTNQVGSLGLLWPWNGDRLKTEKNRFLRNMVPFLISYHILLYVIHTLCIVSCGYI